MRPSRLDSGRVEERAGQPRGHNPAKYPHPTHPAAPCPARPPARSQEDTLEKARDKMGRRSSPGHLPTRARGRAASPRSTSHYPQGPEQISYSLGVEGAPGHRLQVLGQRRGKPAQRQHDHRHKPLAEPALPRPGHLPGSRLQFGIPWRVLSKDRLAFPCRAALRPAQAPILRGRRP